MNNKPNLGALVLASGLSLNACSMTNNIHKTVYDTQNDANNILVSYNTNKTNQGNNISSNDNLNINQSISHIGKNETDYFMRFFNLNNSNFTSYVKKIQYESGLKADGMIGIQTLKRIYLNYYSLEEYKLDEFRKIRLDVLKGTPGKTYGSKVDVFNHTTFLGNGVGEKFSGTHINEIIYNNVLNGRIPKIIDEKNAILKLRKFNGKYILLFYVNGNLQVGTYVSPGVGTPSSYYGGNKELIKNKVSIKYQRAPMPLAIHVTGGIFIHGSNSQIDGYNRSHGCIRVPLYYQNKIFDMVSEFGGNVIVDLTGKNKEM